MISKIKIVIANECDLARQCMALALETTSDIIVAGECKGTAELIEMRRRTNPDVIILERSLLGMDGLQVIELIKKYPHRSRIIIVGMDFTNLSIKALIAIGVRGFLQKNSDFKNLINAVREVYEERYYFCKEINKNIVKELSLTKVISGALNHIILTDVEVQILKAICDEKDKTEIALSINRSKRQLDRCLKDLYVKTKTKTEVGLALFAVKNSYFFLVI